MSLYAQITVAIHDGGPGGLEGFSTITGRLPRSVYDDALEDGQGMKDSGATFAVFLDLMDGDNTQADEKVISVEQAARILDISPEQVVPVARQRLAQTNDEFAESCAARRRAAQVVTP